MELTINDNYRLRSDAYNIILEEKSIIKTGKLAGSETWNTLGYYPTIELALNGHLNKVIRNLKSNGIFYLLEVIEGVRNDIQSLKIEFKKEAEEGNNELE